MDKVMAEKYQTLSVGVDFRSKKIEEVVVQIWELFFARIEKLDYDVDRAVWICNRFPAWLGVKPGSEQDDYYEEPTFVVSVPIRQIDKIRDELRDKRLAESAYQKEMGPIYKEYYNWLKLAIEKGFENARIIKLRESLIEGKFGVYTTEIDDLHTSELSEMDFIAGDRLPE
jgi:hypothetical protein